MIVLDASALIVHLHPRDTHHVTATDRLLEASPGSILIHALTPAEVLVGGVRVGRAAMRDDPHAAGGYTAQADGDLLRLAELRASSGVKLPDCCVLDLALHHDAALATFDSALAAQKRQRDIAVLP